MLYHGVVARFRTEAELTGTVMDDHSYKEKLRSAAYVK